MARNSGRAQRSYGADETVALVFCGGEGKRLRPITYLMSKGMLPAGPERRPILEYIVRHIRYHAIQKVLFLGCARRGTVGDYFGDGSSFGMEIDYLADPGNCRGTGHALVNAIQRRGLKRCKRLLLHYGDILNLINLSKFIEIHDHYHSAATIALSENYNLRFGIAKVGDHGRVTSFSEKPPWKKGAEKVNVGLACVNPKRLLKACGAAVRPPLVPRDLMNDIIPLLIRKGETVWSYTASEPWVDVGTFEEYNQLDNELKQDRWQEIHTVLSRTSPCYREVPVPPVPASPGGKRVFIVHGRNIKARRELVVFLRSIGLRLLEWNQAIAETGKSAPYIGEILDAAFSRVQAVIVLMTPDDEACLRKEFRKRGEPTCETKPMPQPRPNVLFEAGMALGCFPNRTVLIQLGDLRPFTDIGGRHIVRLDNSVRMRQQLAERLKSAGCPVDLSGTDWHSAGDFESALETK